MRSFLFVPADSERKREALHFAESKEKHRLIHRCDRLAQADRCRVAKPQQFGAEDDIVLDDLQRGLGVLHRVFEKLQELHGRRWHDRQIGHSCDNFFGSHSSWRAGLARYFMDESMVSAP